MKDYRESSRQSTQAEMVESLARLYIDKKWSIKEIAKATGLPKKFVVRLLKSGGIEVKFTTGRPSTGGVIRRG